MSSRLMLVVISLVLFLNSIQARHLRHRIQLQFYMHDLVNLEVPKDSSTVLVAGPKNDLKAFNTFGSIMVIDDPLTEGPSSDSKLVGRAQGFYVSDSKHSTVPNYNLLMSFTASFPNGTLSFHGQEVITDTVRKVAVVGGTEAFQCATGYAEIRTYKLIPPLAAILRVKVFLKQ